jgi:hypothetical protein
MRILKAQLNTPPAYTRDMVITLTNQVSGAQKQLKPYLDGSISIPNLEAGQWRIQVKHPNMVFDLYDRNIRVFQDRPTITSIKIPTNVFEDVPTRDTSEGDLGGVQSDLAGIEAASERQAQKQGGQPIYADDWNNLADTVANLSKATRDLTERVAPAGHKHSEMISQIEDIHGSIQRLGDRLEWAVAAIWRELQRRSLQSKVKAVKDKNILSEAKNQELEKDLKELENSWLDQPGVYSDKKRRVAEKIHHELTQGIAEAEPDVIIDDEVQDALDFTYAMWTEPRVITYTEELTQHKRASRRANKNTVSQAFDSIPSAHL